MEYYKKAKELMDMEATDFVGGVCNADIDNAMKELDICFPESYKSFLHDFGGGDAGGEIIFGLTGNEEDDIVKITTMERSQGLNKKLIVIAVFDDNLICLDTSRLKYDGECPVVEVSTEYDITEIVAKSFGKFLYDYVNEC